MKIDINRMERLELFRLFDKLRYNWSLSEDQRRLVHRIETELERYPKKETEHESRTIPAPQTD